MLIVSEASALPGQPLCPLSGPPERSPEERGSRMQQSRMRCPATPEAASGNQDIFHWGNSWGLSVTPSPQGLSLRSSCFLGNGAGVRGAARRQACSHPCPSPPTTALGQTLRLPGPLLDFHDKYSNGDRQCGQPCSCQPGLLAGLINCFTISRPAGGPLVGCFCPPSGGRMEQAAECAWRQPPCAKLVTSFCRKMNLN